jgi:hypothetical protein
MLQVLLFFSVFSIQSAVSTVSHESPLFNTGFLSDPERVSSHLEEKGFYRVSVSSNGPTLEGFFLNRKGEKTVIAVAGFLPGKITGMATLYELIPDTYNILLVNLRGKGNSDGRTSLYTLWRYGVDEYRDVCAAIEFAHAQLPHASIIMHGICAGGFHVMKAIAHLAQHNKQLYNSIEHAVIDSSFSSIIKTGRTAICGEIDKQCRRLYCGSIFACTLKATYLAFNITVASPLMYMNSSELIITPAMLQRAAQKCHFTFIHGTGDCYAPLADIQKLIQHLERHQYSTHYFNENSHASLHLKFQKEYKRILHKLTSNTDQQHYYYGPLYSLLKKPYTPNVDTSLRMLTRASVLVKT